VCRQRLIEEHRCTYVLLMPTHAADTLLAAQATARDLSSMRVLGAPAGAYRLLEAGRLTAVADTEPGAWAAVEHRSTLLVAATGETGDDDVMVAAGPDTRPVPRAAPARGVGAPARSRAPDRGGGGARRR